jgi:hypothetical protein
MARCWSCCVRNWNALRRVDRSCSFCSSQISGVSSLGFAARCLTEKAGKDVR